MSGVTRHDFGELRKTAHSLAYDREVAKKRITNLEEAAAQMALVLYGRSFWGRLKWLLLGR